MEWAAENRSTQCSLSLSVPQPLPRAPDKTCCGSVRGGRVLTSCRTARIRADVIQLLSGYRKRYWLPGRFLPPLSQVGHLASGTASPGPIWPLAWSWGSLQPCQREVRRTWICYASGMRTACCRMRWEAESSSFWCVYIKWRSSPWCQLFVQVWDHPGALQIFIMRNLTVERSASCSGKIWLEVILLLLSKFLFWILHSRRIKTLLAGTH